MSSQRVRRIAQAAAQRAPLEREGTDAYRILNAAADGTPEITADRFADVLVVSFYSELEPKLERAWVEDLAQALGPRAIYVKRRPREARVAANTRLGALAPAAPEYGSAVDSRVVQERSLRFEIRPGQGLSVGLYLDMRETRAWVSAAARGKTVLNLFAYTCAFGVAALAGGASRVLNLDLSRKVLDWGAVNARLNGFEPGARDFFAGDALDWLGRVARKSERYDLVVADPPSFSTGKKGRFSAASDYGDLACAAARVVAAAGSLVACCNLAQLSESRFRAMVDSGVAASGRRGRLVHRLGASPIDFPLADGTPPALKVLIYELA